MSDTDKCEVCGNLKPGRKHFRYYAKALKVGDSKKGKEIYKIKYTSHYTTTTITTTEYYYDVQERSAFICKDCFEKEKRAHGIGFFSFYKARELGSRMVDVLKGKTVQDFDVSHPKGVLKRITFLDNV
jgi:hypothetical protein